MSPTIRDNAERYFLPRQPGMNLPSFRMTVYGHPEPAGSKTGGVTKQGRRFYRDANPKAADWKRIVAHRAGELMQGGELLRGALRLSLTFTLPRPKGHYGKKGLLPSAPRWPITKPDTTKLVRGVEDALTGIVWQDDAQVVVQTATKVYGEQVGVQIEVTEIR